MAKTAVTLPALKKSGIAGIKEMRDTVGHIITVVQGEALKKTFREAGELLRAALIENAPGPSLGNKAFPAGTLKAGMFIADGPPTKSNILVGVRGSMGGNKKSRGAAYLGIWHEFGTVKMKPNPFFRRSINQMKSPMASIIAHGIRATVEKAAVEG